MKISIITVTYNSEKTLEDTIQSVIRQTYKDIEYILIDGASTDNTPEIISKYSSAITTYISEPDNGIYDAMNKGINQATGDFIGFIHADDILAHNEVVAQLVETITQNSADVVYGNLNYVKADDLSVVVRRWLSGEFIKKNLSRGWMPPHPTLYVKKELYNKIGLFNVKYRIAADYDFILRLLTLPELKVAYLNMVMVNMRLGGASNKSIKNIIQKSREDLTVLRSNGVGGIYALIYKNISKIPQFFKAQ